MVMMSRTAAAALRQWCHRVVKNPQVQWHAGQPLFRRPDHLWSSSSQSTVASRPLRPFQIEQYEGWLASIGLSDSDVEPLHLRDLLDLANDETRQQWEELSLGYPLHVQGEPQLRNEIIQQFYPKLKRDDFGSSMKHINCMAPQEGIFCAMQALLHTGDHVIVAGPTYQSLSEIPRSMGCEVTHWLPTTGENGGSFRFDPETLRELVTKSSRPTKLVVVHFPHNPTGALPTPTEWKEMIQICRDYGGVYLFCDEMYHGLEHEGVESLDPVVEAYERGISLSGLSKSFGLAGLRMGWVASRDDQLMTRIQQIKDYTTICTSAPSQVLGLIAVQNTTSLQQRCRSIVQTVRKDVEAFCRKHDDILEWAEPRAGSFVFPKLLQHLSVQGGTVGAKRYCDELLKSSDIMLLPSSLFEYGEHHPVDDSRVRISLGRTTIPQHLQKWEEHGM